MIYDIELTAGQSRPLAYTGSYFRILSAAGDIDARFAMADGGSLQSLVLAGIGLPLPQFNSLVLTSPVTQVVRVFIGPVAIDDNRLAGTVDLSGALNMLQSGATGAAVGVVSVTDTATLVAAANPDRRSILMQTDIAVWYGTAATVTTATGFPVAAGGSLLLENTLAVYLIAAAGTVAAVNSLEESN